MKYLVSEEELNYLCDGCSDEIEDPKAEKIRKDKQPIELLTEGVFNIEKNKYGSKVMINVPDGRTFYFDWLIPNERLNNTKAKIYIEVSK